MPVAESQLLDIRQFIAVQYQERYKAFVIHNPPMTRKTSFAKRLAALENGVYLDVMDHVAGSKELSDKIDLLDIKFLRQLALDAASDGAGLVVVDEFDFLLPVWGDDLTGLHEVVRKLDGATTPATVVFVLQTRPALEDWRLVNDKNGQSRVLALSSIAALP